MEKIELTTNDKKRMIKLRRIRKTRNGQNTPIKLNLNKIGIPKHDTIIIIIIMGDINATREAYDSKANE